MLEFMIDSFIFGSIINSRSPAALTIVTLCL